MTIQNYIINLQWVVLLKDIVYKFLRLIWFYRMLIYLLVVCIVVLTNLYIPIDFTNTAPLENGLQQNTLILPGRGQKIPATLLQ